MTEVRSPTQFLPPLPARGSGGSPGSTPASGSTGPGRRHWRNRGAVVAAGVGAVVALSIALAAVRAGGSAPPAPSTTVPTAVPLSVAPTTAPPTTAAPTTTTPRPTTTTAAAHAPPPTNPKGKGKNKD